MMYVRLEFFLLMILVIGSMRILPNHLSAQSKTAVTIEELRSLPDVYSPQLSPDGKYVLYTVATNQYPENSFESKLMVLDLEQKLATQLTKNVGQAKWSPQGDRISFQGSFGGVAGIFVADFLTKRKPQIDIPILVAPVSSSNHFLGHPTNKNYAWSPDGQYIAFVSADTSTCQNIDDPNAPLVIDRLLYKSRTSISDGCLTKIYLANFAGLPVRCLTPDAYDSHSLSWSADSKYVLFSSNRTEDPDYNYNNDLWKVNISSGVETQLTNTVGTEHQPIGAPNGNNLIFTGTQRPMNTKDSPPENTIIQWLDFTENQESPIRLAEDLDRRITNPQWHPDGEWIYFTARDQGKNVLFRTQKGGKTEKVIDEEGMVGSFDIGKDFLIYTMSKPDQPSEIYRANLDGSQKRPLTSETFTWKVNHQIANFESFYFKSFDDKEVQGFLAYPEVGPGEQLPVVHRIHGGPHGMYGFRFDEFTQLLVSRGYAVLLINPRGSTGYGQVFADGTYQAWGGGDFHDLMYGMDAALEKYDFLDENRLGVTGGSYGGFMTNWVVTQTNRYKAAVTVASVSNLISFYGTSLYQLLIETEFNGLPWHNYDLLWHFSPMRHIHQVQTPTLIIHGENDHDVPITQGEEFYIGLKKRRIPTKFIRYPNEGHGIRQPLHREHYYQSILEWFDQYLGG